MGKYCLTIILGLFFSCNHKENVLYEELTPKEFSERLGNCPVAYLPLGTLEWHGEHLPLGSDGLQPLEFFKRLAAEAGGIVLPMIFLGPDFYDPGYDSELNGTKYYGMDYFSYPLPDNRYEPHKLTGSAYWVSDSIFHGIVNSIMDQLSRAGFKIVVAHGHGPSNNFIENHAEDLMNNYKLRVITCRGNDSADFCFQCDHAAANETSIMMALRPDLVDMENLPQDTTIWPLGIGGKDPRIHASRDAGKKIIDYEIKKMKKRIQSELLKIN